VCITCKTFVAENESRLILARYDSKLSSVLIGNKNIDIDTCTWHVLIHGGNPQLFEVMVAVFDKEFAWEFEISH